MAIEIAAAIAVVVLALLLSGSAVITLPVGVICAIYALTMEQPLWVAAALGATGVMLGRVWLAVETRRGRDRTRGRYAAQQEQLASFISRTPSFWSMSFVAGAVPFMPAGFLFPLLGRMRLPVRYAALGTLVGQVPLQLIVAWLAAQLGGALTASDAEAARFLALFAIAWVMFGLLARIDWRHLAEHRRLRMLPLDEREPRVRVYGGMQGWPGAGGAPWQRGDEHDGQMIEGELVDEESDAPPPRGHATHGQPDPDQPESGTGPERGAPPEGPGSAGGGEAGSSDGSRGT